MGNKRKLNILLINPSQKTVYGGMRAPVQMHMGLAYIAAVLDQDPANRVSIIDVDAEEIGPGALATRIKRLKPAIVGITVTTPTFTSAMDAAKTIKRQCPDTLVVTGGIHATLRPFEMLQDKHIDITVKGEGEIAFREIVEYVRGKRILASIPGIAYNKGGEVKETPPRPLLNDLDALPFPARGLFKNDQYTYPDALYRRTAPIITSRGCPGRCSYCNAHRVFQRTFRPRTAGNVVDEIELLVTKMGIKEIHIWDDNFTTDAERVFQIRDEIRKRRIRVKFAFPNGIRADFLNEKVLRSLKEMGTYSIAIGVESGSQRVLNRARKGIQRDRIKGIITLAKEMGFETWAFFMIGLENETVRTIKQTIRFALRTNPDIAKFHILKPYPGTEVYEHLRSKNYILTEDYDQFGIHTPPIHRLESLSPDDMLEWQKKAYRIFYLRPGKMAEQILRVKNLNRLLRNVRTGVDLFTMVLKK